MPNDEKGKVLTSRRGRSSVPKSGEERKKKLQQQAQGRHSSIGHKRKGSGRNPNLDNVGHCQRKKGRCYFRGKHIRWQKPKRSMDGIGDSVSVDQV